MNKKLDWNQFVNFWVQFYRENRKCKDDEYYLKPLNKRGNYNTEDIYKFIKWKFESTMGLSTIEQRWEQIWEDAVESRLNEINKFCRQGFSKVVFENYSESVRIFMTQNPIPIVGNVLMAHICHPENLPLLDKFVFISFNFFTTKNQETKKCFSLLMPKDYEDYWQYRHFVINISRKHNLNLRDIDKALMAFGKFLEKPLRSL